MNLHAQVSFGVKPSPFVLQLQESLVHLEDLEGRNLNGFRSTECAEVNQRRQKSIVKLGASSYRETKGINLECVVPSEGRYTSRGLKQENQSLKQRTILHS